jgi:hypothetical protein
MKTSILAALLVLIFCYSANGRLGETIEQVEKRYYSHNAVGGDYIRRYSFHGYRILVTFSPKGISVLECFLKEDGDTMTDEEIESILSANTLGSNWQVLPNYDCKVWHLESKKAQAMYRDKQLSLGTNFHVDSVLEFLKRDEERERILKEKEKAARLKGF